MATLTSVLILLACSSGHGADLFAGQGGGATGHPATGGSVSAGGSVSTGGGVSTGGVSPNEGGRSGESGGSGLAGGGRSAGGSGNGGWSAASGGTGGDRGGNVSVSGAGTSAAGGSPGAGPRTLFYLDVSGRVLRLDEGAASSRVLVSAAGDGPDGISVDLEGGHIYWSTMGVPAENDGSIRRADLDGSNAVDIVPVGDTYTPKQLKLDASNKKLYWSDREGMRVQRASLDGSDLETLVSTGTTAADRKDASNWCVGLALDLAGGYFYWTQKGPDDGGVGSIRRAHVRMPRGENARNRSDIEVLYEGLPEPVDLDVDASTGTMYWTDRGDDTINRAPIEVPQGRTAATRSDREILIRGVREAIGIALDLERGHLYFTGATNGRVGRANLDGSGATNLLTGSGALTGVTVVQLP